METMVFVDSNEPPIWLDHTQTINGNKWIVGIGPLPAEIMFIGDHPGRDEVTMNEVFTGPSGKILYDMADKYHVDLRRAFLTNVVKFLPKMKHPAADEIKLCTPMLNEEIKRCNPKLIVCLGKQAFTAVMGRGYKTSEYRGTLLDWIKDPAVKVFPMYNPAYLLHNPDAMPEYDADWKTLQRVVGGGDAIQDDTQMFTTSKLDDVVAFVDMILSRDDPVVVLDCEWHGENWMSPIGYLRTVQIGMGDHKALIIEIVDETGKQLLDDFDDVFKQLKRLLEDSRIRIIGHAARSDGQWLMGYGIDIRAGVMRGGDTMIAEHLINSTGPFGLEALTVKYTDMGRYDLPLMNWKNEHHQECEHGYGPIPRDILLPYAAKDVDAPDRIFQKQLPMIAPFREPRGPYPSLWDIDMHTQNSLYELEGVGMLLDQDRLHNFIKMYQEKRNDLEAKLIDMAKTLGLTEFNYRAPHQVAHLLFQVLGMVPIKTTDATGGRSWDWVEDQAPEVQEQCSASTNKETLAILADQPGAHPIIALLRDAKKVEYVCRQWLVEPDHAKEFDTASRGGGLLSKIWPDGRLHARFSQLKETARFSSSKPNVQNWLKRAEGELRRIMGKDLPMKYFGVDSLPSIRTVVVPTPGYVFMESDWKQAELFILAALSGDPTMWGALTTPGKDLHDLTAITSFDLQVVDQEGKAVPEDYLLQLAKTDEKAFKAFQKKLIYINARGQKLTRDAFRAGLRVSAKNLRKYLKFGQKDVKFLGLLQSNLQTETSLIR